MNNLAKLRQRLQTSDSPAVQGQWRSISACLDEDTGEFLNVGVMFQYAGKVELRMLDSFERVKCLYGGRVSRDELEHLMQDIEETIRQSHWDLPDKISDTIRLGQPLYAQGADAESVVDEFFLDVVTLGKPTNRLRNQNFRYRSSQKVRDTLFEIMREKMVLSADRIIQNEPYRLKLNNKAVIDVDVPLLSSTAAGSIVSVWYKSPLVVENNLLQAASDLLLISSNSERTKTSLSVLVPPSDSGMTNSEYNKQREMTKRHLDRFQQSGIEVIEAVSTDVLANKTIEWWGRVA